MAKERQENSNINIQNTIIMEQSQGIVIPFTLALLIIINNLNWKQSIYSFLIMNKLQFTQNKISLQQKETFLRVKSIPRKFTPGERKAR